MYDWLQYLTYERRNALLGESQEYRLVQEALANQRQEKRPALYGRSLAWMGGRLKILGEHLEQRYSEASILQLETSEGC